MRLVICALIVVSVALLSSFGMAKENLNGPVGRYCGAVYHAGYEVKSEVIFQLGPDGKITGTMHYRDDAVVTGGTIEELNKESGTERTIQWKDKYGYGFAILKFDEKFDHFEGRWGSGMSAPQYPWTGKRCDDFTS